MGRGPELLLGGARRKGDASTLVDGACVHPLITPELNFRLDGV